MISAVLFALASTTPGSFELEWRAPAHCAPKPDVATLTSGASGRAEVELRDAGSQWDVTVLFFEPFEGVRRLTATSCEEAAKAAALFVQLASRGRFAAAEAAPIVRTEAPVSAPSPVTPVSFALHGGAALDVGTLPIADPRLAISAHLGVGLLRLAIDVRFGPKHVLSRLGAEVARAAEAQVSACLNFTAGRLAAGPCAALAVSSWRVEKSALTAETFLLAASPQVRATWLITGGLEAGAVLGLRLNLRRPQPFDASGVLFETSLLAGDFQLTLGWRW